MSLIAIGDIHGCAATLDALIQRLEPAADDEIVFVGDYIDRGPDAKGVIERLLALNERYRCVFLRGNHESLMLDYLDYHEFYPWQVNGGVATINSYRDDGGRFRIPDVHLRFVRQTRLHYETDAFFFVHAGLKPHLTIDENIERFDDAVFLWERGHLTAKRLAWEKTVVCGHTPQPQPIDRDRLIMIDTGCVYHEREGLGRLTAVRLPERTFISQPYAG